MSKSNHIEVIRWRDRVIVAMLGYLLVNSAFGGFYGGLFLVGFGLGGLILKGGE